MSSRRRDEAYALALCDEVVGEPSIREARFDWLLGDVSEKTGRRMKLPVDAYWPRLKLVVEFWERQHDVATPFFDKPDVLTVSKVPRSEQRRLYDLRRADVIPQQGLHLVIIKLADLSCNARGKLLHDRDADLVTIRALLSDAIAATSTHEEPEASFEQQLKAFAEASSQKHYDQGARHQVLDELVGRDVAAVVDRAAGNVVLSLEASKAAMLDEHESIRQTFLARHRQRWGPALDDMYATIVVASEAGSDFVSSHAPPFPPSLIALAALHARAWRACLETHSLLTDGFGLGALARARTVMELAATSILISESGSDPDNADLAQRYLDHDAISRYRDALEYQEAAERLDYELRTPAEMEQLKSARDHVIAMYGKDFAKTNGWAGKLLGSSGPRYVDLEEAAGLNHLRPYYSWASHSIHSGSKGAFQSQVLSTDRLVLRPGPHDDGIADAGQLALIAFGQVTSALLNHNGNLAPEEMLQVAIINRLVTQANEHLAAKLRE